MIAFLTLPELLSANVIRLNKLAKNESASVSPAKKKKAGNLLSDRWRPTKAEVREAFISHAVDDSYIKVTVEKRQRVICEKGLTPQPYVLMVGPNLSKIKSYFVVINQNIIYYSPHILNAVDTCFKIIWALNLEYAADSYGPWYFIQKGFYKLHSSYDKGSTSVESLLTDCNLI